ncbi:MAG: hypothetical protein HZA49_06675 [Planctomycetes bacterium]|nr:hypothetical protein [Planctomycetota bacterium]
MSFNKNMFWAWKEGNITTCRVGFIDWENIIKFRDKLIDNLCKERGLFAHRIKGYTEMDFDIELYSVENEDVVWQFIAKDKPNILSAIFRTKYYKEWKKEDNSISKLVKVDLDCGHDQPNACLIVESRIHSPGELMVDIKKTMDDLKMESYENSKLNDAIIGNWGGPDIDIEPLSK